MSDPTQQDKFEYDYDDPPPEAADGTYNAVISKCVPRPTAGGPDKPSCPMLVIELTLGDAIEGGDADSHGRTVTAFLTMFPPSHKQFQRNVRAAKTFLASTGLSGLPKSYRMPATEESVKEELGEFALTAKGQECVVKVATKPGRDGEKRLQVDFVASV